MLERLDKAPYPQFGGKQAAAPAIWAALGDVAHLCDPFCGSLAVLLRRPHPCNRTYYSETVNDADGYLVNAWRSIQWSPEETAEWASWPVAEADLHARHLWLLRWKAERNLELLMGDPEWHDPRAAGYWLWGVSSWIGSGFCSGRGPWIVGADGRITKRSGTGNGVKNQRPHLGDNGRGVNRPQARELGVNVNRPHLGNDGQGVNHAGTREQGVHAKLPHLGDDGKGVNRPQAREPGVGRQLPHLGDDGQGVNHAGTREQGVHAKLPHLGDDGKGVNHAGTREPGVSRARPFLFHSQGANTPATWEPGAGAEPEFHPLTMPELRRWFRFLSARLRHVRILNGDWKRLCTDGALKTLPVRQGDGKVGVFLDPPYRVTGTRAADLYTHDGGDEVAADVRAWCLANGDDPQKRIVLAGFAGEGHEVLEARGWRCVEWYTKGFLRGGMANQSENGTQQHQERLWCSPACLGVELGGLFAGVDDDDL